MDKERNKQVLFAARKQVRGLLADARQANMQNLVRKYTKELKVIEQSFRAIAAFGGQVKPMRTPWKRMLGPQYYEEL